MKILIDFLPLVLFFGAYKLYGIYVATGVIMASTTLQMLYIYKTEGALQGMHKATLGLVLVFGALTLFLQDERFIKWKPTLLYIGIALAFALALWVWRKNLLKAALGKQIALPEFAWTNLVYIWVGYALFMAALNAYVVLTASTEEWVNFKLWGYIFPLLFVIGQGVYVAKHIQSDAQSEEQ